MQKKCGAACGCRKAGLKCSPICLNCNGDSCDNVAILNLFDDDEVTGEVTDEVIDFSQDFLTSNAQSLTGIRQDDENILDQELEEPGPICKRTKHH